MFCHPDAGPRNHEGSCGGDIEGSGGIPSRAARVDQHLTLSAGESRDDTGLRTDRRCFNTDHAGKSDQLIDGLPFHSETGKKSRDLSIGRVAAHDGFHHGLRLGPVEVLSVYNSADSFYDVQRVYL
jgi:hypothetical protein